MAVMPKCSDPKGPLYCNDPDCPARDETGRHIVTVQSSDLSKGLQDRLNKKAKPAVTPTPKHKQTPAAQLAIPTVQEPLFDIDAEWIGTVINFYYEAKGAEPAFYADQGQEVIVAKIESGRKRNIYIVAKGALRVIYGKHIIRTTQKLVSIGIDSDKKLQRALARELIQITSQPKFEAVEIRYLGRKDETRTPIGISNPNLSSVLFDVVKYLND